MGLYHCMKYSSGSDVVLPAAVWKLYLQCCKRFYLYCCFGICSLTVILSIIFRYYVGGDCQKRIEESLCLLGIHMKQINKHKVVMWRSLHVSISLFTTFTFFLPLLLDPSPLIQLNSMYKR